MIKEPVQPHLLLLLPQLLHHFRGLCQHGQRCCDTTTAGVSAGQQQADAALCNGVLAQLRTALQYSNTSAIVSVQVSATARY